jgi:adenylate kinase
MQVCDALEDKMEVGGVIIDYHGCDFFPERWFDIVIVLKTDNTVLWERLEKRGYGTKKLQENVQCEIMHVIAEEARESYAEDIVHIMPSNTTEDIEANVERLLSWTKEATKNCGR